MLVPIFHHYPQSPIAEKIRMTFGIMALEWHSVQIPRIPPKPLLMPLTGGYRRTPVLQIGADIFCDSQSIAFQLSKLKTNKVAYLSSDRALELILGSFGENILFNLTVRIVLTTSMGIAPDDFIQDRGSLYFEPGWTVEEMQTSLPGVLLQLQSALELVNHHLASHGPYMNGKNPSYADAVIQHCVWFLCGRWDGGESFIAPFKALIKHRELITQIGHGSYIECAPEEALKIAKHHISTAPKGINCAYAGKLKIGESVVIRPNGKTSDPDVTGVLRYLDQNIIILDYEHEDVGLVSIHFPILGYQLSAR